MLIYTINRILQLIPIVLILSFIVFMMVEALPGDIIDTMADIDTEIDDETRAALEKELGLDQPWFVRYGWWLGDILRGEFGNSLVTRRPVYLELIERIPATLYLAAVGIALSLIIAIPFGTFAAVRRNSITDYSAQVTSLVGISIPEFWFAILSILVFSLYFGILPSSLMKSVRIMSSPTARWVCQRARLSTNIPCAMH